MSILTHHCYGAVVPRPLCHTDVGTTGSCTGVHPLLLPVCRAKAAVLPGLCCCRHGASAEHHKIRLDFSWCFYKPILSGRSKWSILAWAFLCSLTPALLLVCALVDAPAALPGTSLNYVSALVKTQRQKQAAVWSEAGKENCACIRWEQKSLCVCHPCTVSNVLHTLLLFQIGTVEVNWGITLDISNHQTILGTTLQTVSVLGILTHRQSAVFWLWFRKYFYR